MYVLWTGTSCPLTTMKNSPKMYGRILTIVEHSLTVWILIIMLLYVQIVPQLISTEVNSETTDQSVHFFPNNRTNSDKMHVDAGKLVPTDKPRHPVVTRRNNRQRKPGKLSDQANPFGLSETKVITEWKRTDPRVFYIDNILNDHAGAQFYDTRIYNYSQFVILPKQSAIYVVENKVTLLKLDMNSFFLLDSYTLPTPQKLIPTCQDSLTCHQAKEISLLAVMPNEQMIWFCYLHYYEHVNRPPQCADSACMVPQPGNLAEPVVQWDNPHFNSLDPTQLASVYNANDGFTYISAFAPDYLRIFRAHMPDWNGRVNWTGALVTDRSRVYIAEPARVLLTFETENEVYFVLREQQSGSNRGPRHPGLSKGGIATEFEGSAVTEAARLIRICKGDRGGLPQRNAETFGTFAKADLHCTAADALGASFAYTHLQAVYWENTTERLFASFSTEKWAPVGSALCVYSKRNIEDAFNGPLLQPSNPGVVQPPTTFPNSFPEICERFNSNNLTSKELAKGRRISLTFPNRKDPIEPMYHKALIVQTGASWIHLQAYSLPPLPTDYHFGNPTHTTVVWLGTKSGLTKLAIYEDLEAIRSAADKQVPIVCKLNELWVGRRLDLLSRTSMDSHPTVRIDPTKTKPPTDRGLSDENIALHYIPRDAKRIGRSIDQRNQPEEIRQIGIYFPRIFIITDRQLLWLPLTDCSTHKTYNECIRAHDPHCGWSWPESRCADGYDLSGTETTAWFTAFSPSVDRRSPTHAQCPTNADGMDGSGERSAAWSTWYPCRLLGGDESRSGMMDGVKTYGRSQGICRCRVCLSQADCVLGTQEVINCTRYERNWLPWSPWSPCDMGTNMQSRQRTCRSGTVCVGSSREQRMCTTKSIWSNQFSALMATAPRYQHSGMSAIREASRSPSSVSRRGFTMTHLILVAVCSLLVGGLITSLIFYALWQPCCILSASTNCNNCSPIKQSSRSGSRGYKNKYKSSHRMGDENWTISDSRKPDTWSGAQSDKTSTWSKCPHSSAVYDTLLGHSNEPRKQPHREHHSRRPHTRCGSSLIQLLSSGTPLPSPTSVISGPSTASTIMKDKFTFDSVDGNEDLTTAGSLRAPSTTPSFGARHSRMAVHTLIRSDKSNGPSVEIIPQVKSGTNMTTDSVLHENIPQNYYHHHVHQNPLHQHVPSSWECTESESVKVNRLKPNVIPENASFNPMNTQTTQS